MDPGYEVFLGVENDIVCTGLACECGFFFCRHSGYDMDTEALGDLDEQQACATGTGMNENFVVELGDESIEQEVVGSHALEDRGGGLLIGDPVRYTDETVRGSDGVGRVSAGDTAPSDAITGGKVLDIRGHGENRAGGFLAERVRQPGGVTAFAEVGINKIDAGGFDADERLTGGGCRVGKLGEDENFRTAGMIYLNGSHSSEC